MQYDNVTTNPSWRTSAILKIVVIYISGKGNVDLYSTHT